MMTFTTDVYTRRVPTPSQNAVPVGLVFFAVPQVVNVSKEVVLAVWSDSPEGRSAYFLTW